MRQEVKKNMAYTRLGLNKGTIFEESHLKHIEDALTEACAPEYGKAVFIGDSIGQGYNNNNYSYIDVAAESGVFKSVIKAAVNGATIGNYSLVSAASGFDGISQVASNSVNISDSSTTHVYIQFGVNDVQSLMAGSVQLGTSSDSVSSTTVCGCVRNIIESIYALNHTVNIYFLNIGVTDRIIEMLATSHYEYNSGSFNKDSFIKYYKRWNSTILPIVKSYGIPIINIFEDINNNDITKSYIFTNDNIHPNNDGHKKIFEKIIGRTSSISSSENNETKKYIISISTTDNTTFTTNANFDEAYETFKNGGIVTFSAPSYYGVYTDATSYSNTVISCSIICKISLYYYMVFIAFRKKDNAIEVEKRRLSFSS